MDETSSTDTCNCSDDEQCAVCRKMGIFIVSALDPESLFSFLRNKGYVVDCSVTAEKVPAPQKPKRFIARRRPRSLDRRPKSKLLRQRIKKEMNMQDFLGAATSYESRGKVVRITHCMTDFNSTMTVVPNATGTQTGIVLRLSARDIDDARHYGLQVDPFTPAFYA